MFIAILNLIENGDTNYFGFIFVTHLMNEFQNMIQNGFALIMLNKIPNPF